MYSVTLGVSSAWVFILFGLSLLKFTWSLLIIRLSRLTPITFEYICLVCLDQSATESFQLWTFVRFTIKISAVMTGKTSALSNRTRHITPEIYSTVIFLTSLYLPPTIHLSNISSWFVAIIPSFPFICCNACALSCLRSFRML